MAREVTAAPAESHTRSILAAAACLVILRGILSVLLPLSFDETYYWMWSRHLAWGYYDHPPMVAFLIRAGTALFGDTSFGVRAGALLLSAAGSWAVWRAGAILLKSEYAAASAALVFNLMPMIGVEALVATPDAPEIAFSAFLLLALAKIAQTGRGLWWIAAGLAAGLALLAKYTGFFLGAGILVWLLLTKRERHWFVSPWPYLGGALALAMFAPVVIWNAEHGWISFLLQFGRVGNGGFTLRFLGEFLGTQLGLATPFIAVLAAAGFVLILRSRDAAHESLTLVAAMMVPAIAYFIGHSLHDRVQGNWPSFVYPMFAVAAVAAGACFAPVGWMGAVLRFSRRAAIPVAALMLGAVYAQSLWGLVPLARDPAARMLAVGFDPVAANIEALRVQSGAKAVVTTNYAPTGWLAFYLPSRVPVVQINERYRWLNEPQPDASLFDGPVLYVTNARNDLAADLARKFARVEPIAKIPRRANGFVMEDYAVYRLEGLRARIFD